MSDTQEQASCFDLMPPDLLHTEVQRPRDLPPGSGARGDSAASLPERGLIEEREEPCDELNALQPLFSEELTQLRPILTTLSAAIGCQLEGETAPREVFGRSDRDSRDGLGPSWLPASSALLHRPGGELFGVLGMLCGHSSPPDNVVSVLEMLVRNVARSISERWFRLHHREDWIVATAPVASPDQGVLLALDQKMNLRGAGFGARELLGTRVREDTSVHWEELFTPTTPMPTMRGNADLTVRLIEVRDGRRWIALLSGPDVRATAAWTSDALVHARPRLHQLAALTPIPREDAPNGPSLTTGMRRRVENFIEARLDTPLSVQQIAQAAGMSCSHFSRAFRNALKMTPHRYLMWRRLVRARELIKSSEASFAEIALTTGFSDQSHLCRLFHQHLGESPRRYRRRWR